MVPALWHWIPHISRASTGKAVVYGCDFEISLESYANSLDLRLRRCAVSAKY